ncbi:MAG: hypothetical protein NVSMB6_06620 [Burkholderiaceae bacterium]
MPEQEQIEEQLRAYLDKIAVTSTTPELGKWRGKITGLQAITG